MRKKVRQQIAVIAAGVLTAVLPCSASANFFIDYQGVEEVESLEIDELRRLRGAPSGYRILSDKTHGIVHQVGEGTIEKANSFGAGMELKDAISILMPEKWIAYIDENVDAPEKVDWYAEEDPWIDVLVKIGSNYGYRFVVDWDQQLLQISPDEEYTAPDYNSPIALTDPESNRTIFVYSAKPDLKGGAILINGEIIPIKK